MRRKYNHKISARANESLRRREAVVRTQKRTIAAAVVILLIIIGVLLGTGMSAFASSDSDPSNYYKYYKSVRVEEGDTLWNMADEYIDGLDIDKSDYVREICDMNHIDGDDICVGDYIIFSYYSKEEK